MNRLFIAILVIFFASCDVLNQEPVSVIAGSNFYKDAQQVEAALSAAYDIFQTGTIGRDFFASASAGSDQATTAPSGGNNNRMNAHAVNADHGPARDLWRECYTAIHRANDVIENVPDINSASLDVGNKRAELLGEAYFLRGFFYFTLVRWYGSVPLILSTTSTSDPAVLNQSRTPLVDIYDQIVDDLSLAAESLPVSYDIDVFTRGRATVGAANGILAKVYLRRAYTDFGQESDFQNAADRAKRVIDNTELYQLVPAEEYARIFAADGGNTVESIFEVQTEEVGLNEGSDLNNEFEARENGGDARARILPSQKLLDALQANPNDIRYEATIGTMDSVLNSGFAFYTTKYNRNGGVLVPNLIILRLADVLLVRAEALNQMGMTAEAIQLLNQVRERAQISPTAAQTQDEVFQAIQDERFVELNFEGHRWHDLSRFLANNYAFARNEYAETEEVSQMDESETYQLLWPINNRELDVNDALQQNPGYN